jgi:hypothetical protein
VTGSRILSFKAWRGDDRGRRHYVGLAEVLTSLGAMVEGHRWRLTVDWLMSPEAEAIASVTANSLVATGDLIELFTADSQLIDGELVGYHGSLLVPDVTIRASDSSWWDVRTDRSELLEKITLLFPDAYELPEW